jgi:hypothetical protein
VIITILAAAVYSLATGYGTLSERLIKLVKVVGSTIAAVFSLFVLVLLFFLIGAYRFYFSATASVVSFCAVWIYQKERSLSALYAGIFAGLVLLVGVYSVEWVGGAISNDLNWQCDYRYCE